MRRRSLPGYAPRGTADRAGQARLTLAELDAAIGTFIRDIYNLTPHGETGIAPQQRWEALASIPRMPDSLEQLDLLLLTVAKPRKIHPDGIDFQGLRYLDPVLAAYVGDTVIIRYDPRDMAEIRVFTGTGFLCRAICPELAGTTISMKDITAARNARRRGLARGLRVGQRRGPAAGRLPGTATAWRRCRARRRHALLPRPCRSGSTGRRRTRAGRASYPESPLLLARKTEPLRHALLIDPRAAELRIELASLQLTRHLNGPGMEKRNDPPPPPPRKPPEKRPAPLNPGMAWWLLALAVVALLVFVYSQQDRAQHLTFGEFTELVRKGKIEVTDRVEGKRYAYSNPTDLVIGPKDISGKVNRVEIEDRARPIAEPATTPPDKAIAFHVNRNEKDDTVVLRGELDQHGISYDISDGPSALTTTWLPYLFLAAILAFIFIIFLRKLGGAGSPMTFGRSRGKLYAQEDLGITFDDVAGIDEAVDELREVVDFLKTPEKYQVLGGRIPKGVLLVGPPGTGKTLLAKAVAGEAGVPFFSLSGSDFVEMFVGVGAARVRDLFQQAEAKAPCIIFIDELDALGKTRGSSVVGGHDEREQTLNELLVEMDGFDSNRGVIVMAATNRPETLDPALLRPGRFDRHVVVDRPDIRGREAILKVHVRNVKLDQSVDLREVAGLTPGFVGADLANLVNEAALLAARKGKSTVSMAEFNEGVERVTAGSGKGAADHARRREAARRLSRKRPRPGRLQPAQHRSGPQGLDHSPRARRAGLYDAAARGGPLPDDAERAGEPHQVLLAGTIAEELIFDDISTGAQNDLEQASEIARSMVMEFGMSRLGRVNYRESNRSPFLAGSGADMAAADAQRADGPRDRRGSAANHRRRHREGPPASGIAPAGPRRRSRRRSWNAR